MNRTTQRLRKAGVAALVAAVSVSGLVYAPPVSAAPADEADLSLTALDQPTISLNTANQPVGPLRINNESAADVDTLTTGDVITVAVDDSSVDLNCTSPTDTVAFSAVPTVAVTGTATVSSALAESANCALLGGGAVNDVLALTVTAGGTFSAINISGITYTVGSGADEGDVQVNGFFDSVNPGPAVPFGDGDDPDASNAIISDTAFSANTPPKGATQGAGAYTASPLVIREAVSTAGDDDFCIDFDGDDLAAGALVVASSGGTDTATATADPASDTITVAVTNGTGATTFTITGVQLERDESGVQSATLLTSDGTCADGGGDVLSPLTNVGGVTDVERFGGSTRFTTAQILFEDQFGCRDWAIIARADLFPDALAASYLAGHANTGILLTNTNDIPAATLNALRNEGVRNVYLMGGTQAISSGVATQFDNTQAHNCGGGPATGPEGTPLTLNVLRIGGGTRYDTAALAAETPGLGEAGFLDITPPTAANPSTDEQRTAIVALGENFPDALAAGPLAFRGDGDNFCCPDREPIPLLLTQQGAVPQATLNALNDLAIENVLVMGGTLAVSDAAVAQLTAAGYTVQRIAGTTRQGTASALVTRLVNEWDFDDDDATLARGDDFPDSLTGGPWGGSQAQGILLTGNATTLSSETSSFISSWEGLFCDELDDVDVLGGTVAVAAATVQAAVDAATLQRAIFCI